jgi:hypothetical protein
VIVLGCQILLWTAYQNEKIIPNDLQNIPNDPQNIPNDLQNIPNDHKIHIPNDYKIQIPKGHKRQKDVTIPNGQKSYQHF